MNIQSYLLCILYIILLIIHSFTLRHKDFHRGLITVFTFALFAETASTVLETLHQLVLTYGRDIQDVTQLDLGSFHNFHYVAQLIHITAINFFILFLLIIAKGWPITRRDIPFKYAFALFWIICLGADLITFYWTTITAVARNFTIAKNSHDNSSIIIGNGIVSSGQVPISTTTISPSGNVEILKTTTSSAMTNLSTTIIENLPKEQEQFNSTPGRLSLLLRIVIMLFFLLELRTTMILEQEKKKLQFYLHFGALTMVWFVHTVIVYIISLRVDSTWQSKLISGFSSAANFLGFAVTTRLLWPKNSRSDLFKKRKRTPPGIEIEEACDLDNFSTLDRDEEARIEMNEEYDGLQMRDLNKSNT